MTADIKKKKNFKEEHFQFFFQFYQFFYKYTKYLHSKALSIIIFYTYMYFIQLSETCATENCFFNSILVYQRYTRLKQSKN